MCPADNDVILRAAAEADPPFTKLDGLVPALPGTRDRDNPGRLAFPGSLGMELEDRSFPAQLDLVAFLKRILLHLFAVKEGAVCAVEIHQNVTVASATDFGVIAGNHALGEHNVVVGLAAEPDGFPVESLFVALMRALVMHEDNGHWAE